MPGIRIGKADEEDFELVRQFRFACEGSLERDKFSFTSPQDKFQEWDEEDVDKVRLLQIKNRLAKEEGISFQDVDNRIVIFEWLQEKFCRCSNSFSRVSMAAYVLIENVCDPTLDYLEFHPGFECTHVAPEQ